VAIIGCEAKCRGWIAFLQHENAPLK